MQKVLIIAAIIFVTVSTWFLEWGLPSLQSQGVENAAAEVQAYFRDGEALEEIRMNARDIETQWADEVESAKLGYAIANIDLFAAEKYIAEAKGIADGYVEKAKSREPALYDEIKRFQSGRVREAIKMQEAILQEARGALDMLKQLKEFEKTQPQNAYAVRAILYARMGDWESVRFYGGKAIAAYTANQPTSP